MDFIVIRVSLESVVQGGVWGPRTSIFAASRRNLKTIKGKLRMEHHKVMYALVVFPNEALL
jgi:hypothetical protein